MATSALVDAQARQTALTAHERTLLVEAGAGSGKTAVLAGRIAMLLMHGIEPKTIAAVTFTELAASELLFRVREFASRMLGGDIPAELQLVLPNGLSDPQKESLLAAEAAIDDITCSTIHGFCQQLMRPYPVEANIDPGASIMDPDQEKLVFMDIVQEWLREQFDGEANGLLAELMLADPSRALALVDVILRHQKENEELQPPPAPELPRLLAAFRENAAAYADFVNTVQVQEAETLGCATAFSSMAQAIAKFDINTPAGLVDLVQVRADASLCTTTGAFKVYKKKGKWEAAAQQIGRSKSEGATLNLEAQKLHELCASTWQELLQGIAAQLLHDLMPVLQPAIQRMQDYKRASALLDFNDLLRAARNLLRGHPPVRAALAGRYCHVLVDEFQDTDPVQTEIFWRLCGDPPAGAADADWRQYRIRPGALFLVGDPKQAIYRFRGADVNAYVWARNAFQSQDPDSVISIVVNFRSCGPILDYVNGRFSAPLGQAGQPGFTALAAFHGPREGGPCVTQLEIAVADDEGKASSTAMRDAEAEAVAKLCAHLIGNELIVDPSTRERRPCRAGDIALLAPTGADLWRYEQALEERGIAVATQAGKGFFRRQEIQDLIAITRVLANSRDTLALGALLRGPVVGLSEEELLDIVWSLRDESTSELVTLSLRLDTERVQHPLAKAVLLKLQALRRSARGTTPHNLLSQAVDELRIRPLLMQRHGRQAERALANVDLYLHFSRTYEVRGLEAFSEAMAAAWRDESRAAEGRPDAQEEAVTLYSMHAAKGLEWPVVVPINSMTLTRTADKDVVARATNTLYCPVFGVSPIGHEAAAAQAKEELERERVRLWYVAATRAREMMIVPRLDVPAPSMSWNALVDLGVAALPAYPLPEDVTAVAAVELEAVNQQSAEVFQGEAAAVAAEKRAIVWLAPSRDEDLEQPLSQEEAPAFFVTSVAGDTHDTGLPSLNIQGGRERGLILHKLLEEVLTGELSDKAETLAARAAELARMIGIAVSEDAAQGLSPDEVAAAVRRALSVDAIAAIRSTLVPEFNVYESRMDEGMERVSTGIVDAISFNADGGAAMVVDWKSDVDPMPEAVAHYQRQVRSYLEITGTPRGLIVFATTGEVHEVSVTPD